MNNELKIKPLQKKELVTALDRLTRFKPTKTKYFRVFSGLICSNLIYPKFKKNEIEEMDCKQIVNLVNKIFDESVKFLNLQNSNEYEINKKLYEYENSIFHLDDEAKTLLKNKIDYKALISILDTENLPCNLVWLKHIEEDNVREKYSAKFPIKKIVLAEGITEEILLPKFAEIYGYNFNQNGIMILPAGGKNQSVKVFYSLCDILKLPIFVLFDNDAKKNSEEIKPKLRKNDFIHILPCGEFEDCLSLNHIKRTLNEIFKNYYKFTINDLRKDYPMSKTLDLIFKKCNSEFKKAEFAQNLSSNIKKEDLTEYIKDLLDAIKNG